MDLKASEGDQLQIYISDVVWGVFWDGWLDHLRRLLIWETLCIYVFTYVCDKHSESHMICIILLQIYLRTRTYIGVCFLI